MIKAIIMQSNNHVFGSIENENCNTYYGIKQNRTPCTHFFKTIFKSFPTYWRKSIEIGPYNKQLETFMKGLKDQIWLVDRLELKKT